jgi:hypothetical protein
MKTKSSKVMFIIISVLIVVIALFGYQFSLSNIQSKKIENVFVDVNGDGLSDLILRGEVIINTGQPNFPQQP